jgi:predicted nucleotidyltransferase
VAPLRIILFGSRARGDSDEASDADLIVVYRTEKRFLDRLAELYAL